MKKKLNPFKPFFLLLPIVLIYSCEDMFEDLGKIEFDSKEYVFHVVIASTNDTGDFKANEPVPGEIIDGLLAEEGLNREEINSAQIGHLTVFVRDDYTKDAVNIDSLGVFDFKLANNKGQEIHVATSNRGQENNVLTIDLLDRDITDIIKDDMIIIKVEGELFRPIYHDLHLELGVSFHIESHILQ